MTKQERLWAHICKMTDEPETVSFEDLVAELDSWLEEKLQSERDNSVDWTGPWDLCDCKED